MRSLSLRQCFSQRQQVTYRYSKHAFPRKKSGHGRVYCAGDNESVCLIRRSEDEVYLMGSSGWYAQNTSGGEWRVWVEGDKGMD
jgi:hypothetical protein